MAVLRFTTSGLVSTPTTLQIRVSRAHPGRLAVGAPVPSRDLRDEEVGAALHHFLVGLRGPRTRPCRAVVLSGDRLAERAELAPWLKAARASMGLERTTLHLGAGERTALRRSPLRAVIDDLVIVVRSESDIADVAALERAAFRVSAVLPLDEAGLPRLETMCSALARLGARRVVLTWPMAGQPPPHAAHVAVRLPGPVRMLESAGTTVVIKGIPPCVLGALCDRTSRTRNRWYVDADHQTDQALLFFPDIVRFAKVDTCRFCSADAHCDGSPKAWLDSRRVGPLRPLAAGSASR